MLSMTNCPLPPGILPLFRESEMELCMPFVRQEAIPDEDLMFGNSPDPFVGSYSGLGQFATDEDFLVFVP
jgi:hypothetical protein